MIQIPAVVRANATRIVGGLLVLSIIGNLFLWNSLRGAWGREGALDVALTVQKQETTEAKTANDKLVIRINELVAEKQALIDQMAADRGQAERELKARDEQILAANRRALQEQRKRDELTKNPTCRAFLDGRIGDFCPDYAARLLERTHYAAGGMRDRDD